MHFAAPPCPARHFGGFLVPMVDSPGRESRGRVPLPTPIPAALPGRRLQPLLSPGLEASGGRVGGRR